MENRAATNPLASVEESNYFMLVRDFILANVTIICFSNMQYAHAEHRVIEVKDTKKEKAENNTLKQIENSLWNH